jgi:hypothetical protein
MDRSAARRSCVARRFGAVLVGVVLAACGVLAGCGGSMPAAAHGLAQAQSPVLRAPADIALLARRSARAVLARVRLPAGARPVPGTSRVLQPPTFHNGAAFGDDYGYVSIVESQQTWRVAASPQVILSDVSAALGPGATSTGEGYGSPAGAIESETWSLPRSDAWFSRRDLSVSVSAGPGNLSTVAVAARVVWIPELLRIPPGVRSVTVALTPSGKVLVRVSHPGAVRAIIAAVDALRPDEAVHAIFGCPALIGPKGPTELRLTFANAAGQTLAVLATEWCPADARLSVTGHGSLQLFAGAALVHELEAISATRLRVSTT